MSRSRTILLGVLGMAVLMALALATHGDLDGDKPPEPARLRLVATRPAGDITLEGRVHDEATRRLIVARAHRAFDRVIDRLAVEPATERVGWAKRLAPALAALADAGPGSSIDRAGGTVTVAAIVPTDTAKLSLLRRVRTSLGDGAVIVDRIVVRGTKPARPKPKPKPKPRPSVAAIVKNTQASLDAVLRRGTIEFEAGSAVITSRGLAVLRGLVPIMRKATAVTVEVAGYTDTSGVVSDNIRLSRQRAEAVRRWLIGRGIAANRLTARGYGAADPVASNDTAGGRARNRRIEMHVKEA